MKIGFLLGAGVSIPAGLPSTAEITGHVLSGAGLARHTDMNYYVMQPLYAHMGQEDEYIPRIRTFLLVLKNIADQFFQCGRFESKPSKDFVRFFGRHETNYEDLFYLATQIHDCDTYEYENPALQPLFDMLISGSVDQLPFISAAQERRWRQLSGSREVCITP